MTIEIYRRRLVYTLNKKCFKPAQITRIVNAMRPGEEANITMKQCSSIISSERKNNPLFCNRFGSRRIFNECFLGLTEDQGPHTPNLVIFLCLTSTCSCAKFEIEGMLCKHILYTMKNKKLLDLPKHCILPRRMIVARYKMSKAKGNLQKDEDGRE
ncbi:hypothetical protein RJ640_013096, partial [Escallonia rubra]